MKFRSPFYNCENYVILLHGLSRTKWSMVGLKVFLKKQGYIVININYPSRKYSIPELVKKFLLPAIKKTCLDKNKKIHFVTHSMGGILVRYLVKYHRPKNLGRVVMLAPPNQGSEVVDWLKKFWLSEIILGRAGKALGTDKNSLPIKLGAVNFEVGVIASDKALSLINFTPLPRPHDGKVSVKSTKMAGLKDFMLVHKSHTFITLAPEVWRQVDFFIKNGRFDQI